VLELNHDPSMRFSYGLNCATIPIVNLLKESFVRPGDCKIVNYELVNHEKLIVNLTPSCNFAMRFVLSPKVYIPECTLFHVCCSHDVPYRF